MSFFTRPGGFGGGGNGGSNERIDMEELYERKQKEEAKRREIYNKILTRVHKQIKSVSKKRNADSFTFYVVPEFIFGIPKYDLNLCIAHVMNELEENGFLVKFIQPNMIFISWEHYVPSYKREEYKKETGITIDKYGNKIKEETNEGNGEDDINMTNTERMMARAKSQRTSSSGVQSMDSLNMGLMNNGGNQQGTGGNTQQGKQKKQYNDIGNYKTIGIYNSDFLKKINNKFKD